MKYDESLHTYLLVSQAPFLSWGSAAYMAPEQITSQHGKPSFALDIWALGCIFIFCILKKHPYHKIDNKKLIMHISEGNLPDELGEVKRIDEDLGYLLVQMLDKEPKLRVIIQQV